MSDDPFAFDDVAGAALAHATHERLTARMALGESPLAAAAELARRGDPPGMRALAGAAAFAAPEDVAALAAGGAQGTDALACVALAHWLSLPLRTAAIDALAHAPLTPAGCAAASELADGPHRPPWSRAAAVAADMAPRTAGALRDEAQRLRDTARQVREGVRGVIHRQGFQRKVASGLLHPAVGALTGDDGDFVAGLLPPVDDAAREPLMPYLVAVLRGPSEAHRARVLGFLQRRWREVAALPLSCAARTPCKHKELHFALAAVKALGAMGAVDELAAAAGAAQGNVRSAALAELARVRGAGGDEGLLDAALRRAEGDADPAVRQRAAALRGQRAR